MKMPYLAVGGLMGVLASPTLHAQTITPMSLNHGWTSFNGCHIEPVVITLPGGTVYYAAGFAPVLGGYMLGLCGVWPGIESPAVTPPGRGAVDPPASGGGPVDRPSIENIFDEPPTIPSNLADLLVDSDDSENNDLQGDNPQGDTNVRHDVVSEAPVTTTPEPASFLLVGSGLAGMAGLAWRRRKR